MNIIVFKPNIEPLNKNFKIKRVPHTNKKRIENIIIPR